MKLIKWLTSQENFCYLSLVLERRQEIIASFPFLTKEANDQDRFSHPFNHPGRNLCDPESPGNLPPLFLGMGYGSFSTVHFYPGLLTGRDDHRVFLWLEKEMGTPVPGSRLRGKSQIFKKRPPNSNAKGGTPRRSKAISGSRQASPCLR